MTDEERASVLEMMSAGDMAWREIEVLERLALPDSWAAIEEAIQDHLSIDTRLAAAAALHRVNRLSRPIDEIIADELMNLSTIENGCTRALLLAEQHPTDRVKQALLWASRNRTECAMHCAALLCYLTGVGQEPFDWNLRPLFLRLDPHNSELEREAAFKELCLLVRMEL